MRLKHDGIVVLCLIGAMLLCGCTGGAAPAEPSPSEAPVATAEPSAVPSTALPDEGLKPDDKPEETDASMYEVAKSFVEKTMPELMEEIGEPISSSYVTSCLGPGQDGELVYDGFKVYTYNNGETETILDVLPD